MTSDPLAGVAVLTIVLAASVSDLRHGEIPTWLPVGGAAVGLLVAGLTGWPALASSAAGLLLGGALLLPLIRARGMGLGDALVLAAAGAWLGGQGVLWAAWWAAFAGAALALVAWQRGQRTFAYVPAIAVGTVAALLTAS